MCNKYALKKTKKGVDSMFEKGSKAWIISLLIKAIFVPVDPWDNGWKYRLTFTGLHDNAGNRFGWSEIIEELREW